MEKKVALVLLAVVALGFWVTGLLFLTGNPFADTTGSYHYNLDNVTVSLPTSLLDGLKVNFSGSGGFPAKYNSVPPVSGNPYTTHNIVVHIGQIQMNISGKNWDIFAARIANEIFLSNFRGVTINSPEVQSNPFTINATTLSFIAAGIVGGFILAFAPRIYLKIRRRK